MQRKLPRIIRVRAAVGTSTTTRRSKITSTNAAHDGSRNFVDAATEDFFATVVTNSWSAFSNVVNRCRRLNFSNG